MKETVGKINECSVIYDDRDGYSIKTEKHEYTLGEIKTLCGISTTDMLVIIRDDERYDKDGWMESPEIIGWIYGATVFENDGLFGKGSYGAEDLRNEIVRIIEDYEKKEINNDGLSE